MRAFATLTALCVASVAAQPTEPAVKPSFRFDASPYLRGALGGAAYGLAASSISHPFDTIKTRLQTKTAVGGSGSVLSRVLGLYRGVGPATAASILFRTVPFIGYEATRSMLRSHRLLESQPLLAALLGGAVGGVMRGCVETPAELAKTRLQVGAGLGSASLLLRGLRSPCLRNAAVIGLFWVAYEASAARRAALPPTLAAFVGGGGCSVLAWAFVRVGHDTCHRATGAAGAAGATGATGPPSVRVACTSQSPLAKLRVPEAQGCPPSDPAHRKLAPGSGVTVSRRVPRHWRRLRGDDSR